MQTKYTTREISENFPAIDDATLRRVRTLIRHALGTTLPSGQGRGDLPSSPVKGDKIATAELETLREACYIGQVEKIAGRMYAACKVATFHHIRKGRLSESCFTQVMHPEEQISLMVKMQIRSVAPWIPASEYSCQFGKIFVSWKPKGEYRFMTDCHDFVGAGLDKLLEKATSIAWKITKEMCMRLSKEEHKATGEWICFNQFVSGSTEIAESLPTQATCLCKLDFSKRFENLPQKGEHSIYQQVKLFWKIVTAELSKLGKLLYLNTTTMNVFLAKSGFARFAKSKGCTVLSAETILACILTDLDTNYLVLGDLIFLQRRGVFMGKRMSMLHSMVVDWTRWFTYMRLLCSTNRQAEASKLRFTFQVADDILNTNAIGFAPLARSLFKVDDTGLLLNEEAMCYTIKIDGTCTCTETAMLDMRIVVRDDKFWIEPCNKYVLKGREDTRFTAWKNVWVRTRAMSVMHSQLTRLALASNNSKAFEKHALHLALHLIVRRGYPTRNILSAIYKFSKSTKGLHHSRRLATVDTDACCDRVRATLLRA